jgi:hypothetical protein
MAHIMAVPEDEKATQIINEERERLIGIVIAAIIGFILGLLPIPHTAHGFQSACYLAVCFFLLYGFYTIWPRMILIIIISTIGFFVIAGVFNEYGHLDWFAEGIATILFPITFYVELWKARPFTAMLATGLFIGYLYLFRLARLRQLARATRIRIRTSDGRTGTVDRDDFDPATMSKL